MFVTRDQVERIVGVLSDHGWSVTKRYIKWFYHKNRGHRFGFDDSQYLEMDSLMGILLWDMDLSTPKTLRELKDEMGVK